MKIFIGGDHAGFELKNKLAEYLKSEGHVVTDFGPSKFDPEDDYPDFIVPVAKAVAEAQINADKESRLPAEASTQAGINADVRGIILGGSGQGEAMVANRFRGVRAAEYYGGNLEIIKLSREHNDANILSLGARFLSFEEAKVAVKLWLETPFSGDPRHIRRTKEIDDLTK